MKFKLAIFALALCLPFSGGLNASDSQLDRQCRFGCDQLFKANIGMARQVKQFFWEMFSSTQFNRSYAVVIGISEFDEYNKLPTKNDPIRVKNFLIKSGFDYVYMLTGKHVNKDRLAQLMDNMRRKVGSNDRFLFYWQGHGETVTGNSGDFGFLPLATSKRGRTDTMLPMRQLKNWDDLLLAKQTLYLLDACFSGLAGTVVMSNELTDLTIQDLAKKGRHILTAGAAQQKTFAHTKLKGSVFTTALLDGLSGKADTTNEYGKDGVVSLGELDLYLRKRINYERTRFRWMRPITPQLTRLSPELGSFFFLTPEYKRLSEMGGHIQRDGGKEVSQGMSGGSIRNKKNIAETITLKVIEPKMASLPSGSFIMGCRKARDDISGSCPTYEKPAHLVQVPAFKIGKTEVTFSEWDRCASDGLCFKFKGVDRGDHPVQGVSWYQVQTYIRWLNQETGKQYKLPTERQWEYAARGGKNTEYPWGNTIDCGSANFGAVFGDCPTKGPKPVATYPANSFGLYDVSGNVSEWVHGCKYNYRNESPTSCDLDSSRVLKGGAWSDPSYYLRSAARTAKAPNIRPPQAGFRLVLLN